jgi:glycerophosphoryl diester phosphodiesterase
VTLRLRSGDGAFLRVGHRGAAALAPPNTIASLERALTMGVDLVEFDALPRSGELVLAHSPEELAPGAPTLEDALRFLRAHAPPEVGIDLDLKWYGYEEEAVDALRRHGLVERTIVCSFFPDSLRLVKELEPRLLVGLSYPWDRRGLSDRRLLAPVIPVGVAALRRSLPFRIGGMLARARADAAMLNHLVLSRAAVERCHRLGAAVFAWTVDDTAALERALAAGVDGVISNDPRLFRR